EHLTVRALQAEADPIGDVVGDRWQHQQTDPADPGHRLQRDVERERDDVVEAGDLQHADERQRHHADTRADRNVTRTLQQVVVRVVLAELSFYPRVGDQQTEQDRHTDRTGEEHRRNRVRPEIQLPGGPDTQ